MLSRSATSLIAAIMFVPLLVFGQAGTPISEFEIPIANSDNRLDVAVIIALMANLENVQEDRYAAVDTFLKRIKGYEIPGIMATSPVPGSHTPCISNCVVWKVEQVDKGDGTTSSYARALSPLEVQLLAGVNVPADVLRLAGTTMILGQAVFNDAVGGEGIFSVLQGIESEDWEDDEGGLEAFNEPWANPFRLFAAGGVMMHDAADALRGAEQSLATGEEQAQSEADSTTEIVSLLMDGGVQTTPDGREVRVATATDLNMPVGDVGNGLTATFTDATAYIDENEMLLVGHRVEGTMVSVEGESRPFFVEVQHSDFRQVPNCSLYEPYRIVTRMGGMLDDEQMAQMEEAQEQLVEFEAQLAAVPPEQRAMVEGMIGSQMDTVRNMANGGAMEHVQEIEEIICNPDLKALFSPIDPAIELASIQRHLVTLGYQPGNTDGVLDILTEVAISQYQAERGMTVTGQPSTELAFALASEVSG